MARNVKLYEIKHQVSGSPLVLGPPNIPINFGSSLAMSANWLAVGARMDSEPIKEGQMSTPMPSSGEVYVYDLNGIK